MPGGAGRDREGEVGLGDQPGLHQRAHVVVGDHTGPSEDGGQLGGVEQARAQQGPGAGQPVGQEQRRRRGHPGPGRGDTDPGGGGDLARDELIRQAGGVDPGAPRPARPRRSHPGRGRRVQPVGEGRVGELARGRTGRARAARPGSAGAPTTPPSAGRRPGPAGTRTTPPTGAPPPPRPHTSRARGANGRARRRRRRRGRSQAVRSFSRFDARSVGQAVLDVAGQIGERGTGAFPGRPHPHPCSLCDTARYGLAVVWSSVWSLSRPTPHPLIERVFDSISTVRTLASARRAPSSGRERA